MAEFGIAASALQVAGMGLKLAQTLTIYVGDVRNADKDIRAVATEVSLVSSTLQNLSMMLQDHETEKLCSQTVIEYAKTTLTACGGAFNDVEAAVKVCMRPDGDVKSTLTMTSRWRWPFRRSRLESLRANLDRLQLGVVLMMGILSYARERAASVQTSVIPTKKELQLLSLLKASSKATERYEALKCSRCLSCRNTAAPPMEGSQYHQVEPTVPTQRTELDDLDLQAIHETSDQLRGCTDAVADLARKLDLAPAKFLHTQLCQTSAIQSSLVQVNRSVGRLVALRNVPRPHDSNLQCSADVTIDNGSSDSPSQPEQRPFQAVSLSSGTTSSDSHPINPTAAEERRANGSGYAMAYYMGTKNGWLELQSSPLMTLRPPKRPSCSRAHLFLLGSILGRPHMTWGQAPRDATERDRIAPLKTSRKLSQSPRGTQTNHVNVVEDVRELVREWTTLRREQA